MMLQLPLPRLAFLVAGGLALAGCSGAIAPELPPPGGGSGSSSGSSSAGAPSSGSPSSGAPSSGTSSGSSSGASSGGPSSGSPSSGSSSSGSSPPAGCTQGAACQPGEGCATATSGATPNACAESCTCDATGHFACATSCPAVDAGCVEVALCVSGDHWDSAQCACVPNACVSQAGGPCGGFVANPCQCAAGLTCVSSGTPDVGGTCEPPKTCCPAGWDMYSCTDADGGAGYNCHNPMLGCASSSTCGGGCDSEVTGRCRTCDPIPCPSNETFDSTQCACVPRPCATAADCTGPLPQICEACGDGGADCAHWACVAGQCTQATLCP